MSTKYLTIKNIMTLFGVSHMTVHHWRQGSEAREALPTEVVNDQPRAVAFLPSKVKAWAKKHKVDMTCEPANLLGEASAAKPGPKTKTLVAKDSKGKIVKTAVKGVIAKATKPAKGNVVALKPAKKASPLKGTKVAARPRAVVAEATAAA